NEWNDTLLMLTNEGGAPDRQLLSIDPADFSMRRVLVAPRPGVPIVSVHPFASALVTVERVDGLLRLVLRHADGNEQSVAFEGPAYTITLTPGQAYEARQLRVVHQSPASPRRWLD